MIKQSLKFFVLFSVLLYASTVLAESQQPAPLSTAPSQCSVSASTSAVPLGTTNCGGYSCANDGNCCGSSVCCPGSMGFYCSRNNMCYSSEAEARKGCGDGYYICNKPAR